MTPDGTNGNAPKPRNDTFFGVEGIVLLLFLGLILSCVGLFAAEDFFKDDGQVFQVMASLVAGFMGSLMTRIKPRQSADSEESKSPPAKP